MGTEFLFRIYSEANELEAARCESVAHDCIQKVRDLEAELSEFKPTSSVGQINLSFPKTEVKVTPDFAKLFLKACEIRVRTLGAFDPFIKSDFRITPADYHFDSEQLIFVKKNSVLKLSFGAIGKGYALDEVAEFLRQAQFNSFVISAGGSSIIRSQVEGIPAEEKIFWVLDKDQAAGDNLGYSGTWLETEPLAQRSLISYSVSAEYERGKHILGGASYAPLQSTLVAEASACMSDALATAFFVAGWEGVSEWGGAAAFLSVDHEQIPSWNGEASKLFKIPADWTQAT